MAAAGFEVAHQLIRGFEVAHQHAIASPYRGSYCFARQILPADACTAWLKNV
jgi:hypothetical protein